MTGDTLDMAAPASGVRRAYRYRMYPTPAEAERLDTWLRLCRDLYNALVAQRWYALQTPDWQRQRSRTYLSLFGPDGQQAAVASSACQLPPEYAELPANVKQEISRRVDATFRRWYERRGGRPRYQSWRRYASIQYESPSIWAIQWDGKSRYGTLRLRAAGHDRHQGHVWDAFQVAVRVDAGLGLPAGEMRTLSVRRHAGHWYASISARHVPPRVLPDTSGAVGIDLRLTRGFLVTSDGDTIEQPTYYANALDQLRAAQHRVSRRKRGSRGREDAVRLLQQAHARVARQRLDFHHKVALSLVQRYHRIVVEDISPLFVVERRRRDPDGAIPDTIERRQATRALDAGWSQFLTILRQKCTEYGREYIVTPCMYTSQTCSVCGAVHDPGADDWFVCPACGVALPVAINAARVILTRELSSV